MIWIFDWVWVVHLCFILMWCSAITWSWFSGALSAWPPGWACEKLRGSTDRTAVPRELAWTFWATTTERELGFSSKLGIIRSSWMSIFMWEVLSGCLCTTSSQLPFPSLIKLSNLKSGVPFLDFCTFYSLPTEGRGKVSEWLRETECLCGCLDAGWR